ncbi:hypothetical protein GN157_07275 [Flavobacterium rakeshii]|uniref:Carboxypeptidase regulatory-like domain-containing protein n=1 Tax=Flavobacterium rakeshii TaxID=1038845 RepID=A0A6N8HEH8_9FLAO|nr:hypothetical protein [Flavobacterium rakeshii]MUV03507.1 hypothetical protein [Flavobacterium rakeshii]
MKKKVKVLLLCIALANGLACFAQQSKKEEIAKKFEDYFLLERENIHAHFDKNVFLTGESVWFKGYVFHRKYNIPFFSCVNIFANLIDENGTILETKLLYGNLGDFTGNFKLDSSLKSGKYYIQFYTNWMNNFTEDESAVYDITVINEETGIPSYLTENAEAEVNITLKPEGNFISDCTNTIGVHITGCDNTPLNIDRAKVLNDKKEEIKEIPLNKLGYGKFDISANTTIGYTLQIELNGKIYSQPLPPVQAKGIAIDINSHVMADKTIIKLKTNSFTYSDIKGKTYFIAINKDNRTSIIDFSFNDNQLEQTILLQNKDLFEGVNTLRILDNNLQEIGQRLFYIHPKNIVNADIKKTFDDNGTVEFKGKINNGNMMSLSVSVIPANTISISEKEDIYGDFLISPYIDGQVKTTAKQYLSDLSRTSKYELDLFLMSQTSKYNWNNIKSNPPKQNYTFDIGLSLKGIINKKKSLKGYYVQISSIKGLLDERTYVINNNEFYLNNIIIPDSCNVSFSLMKPGQKPEILKLTPTVSNNIRPFNKPYKPVKVSCINYTTSADSEIALPKYASKSVMLENITIDGDAKKKLKYARGSGNGLLRGYKISEDDAISFFYLLDFIRYHGFDVTKTPMGDINITGRTVNTFQGQPTTPMVYMNTWLLMSFDVLDGIQTSEVEELYINQHIAVPGVDNKMGIIKIYLKPGGGFKSKSKKPEASFLIKKGFEENSEFKNSEYLSTYDDIGFQNFGLIDWHPTIITDDKGEFSFSVPKLYSGSVKILIEGIGPDGKMISEIKTVNL